MNKQIYVTLYILEQIYIRWFKSPSYATVEKDETIQLSTVMLGNYYNKLTSNNYNDLTSI